MRQKLNQPPADSSQIKQDPKQHMYSCLVAPFEENIWNSPQAVGKGFMTNASSQGDSYDTFSVLRPFAYAKW